MEFRDKLYTLRKARKMSQEDLGEILGVSRQAVQKWEAGTASPDMKNLLGISEYFSVSLDVLLKNELELEQNISEEEATNPPTQSNWSRIDYEYKSERIWFGLPLIHINLGPGLRRAQGIIAIGNIAIGLLTIGGFSCGLFSFGGFCLGLLALGGFSLGGLAIGGITAGIIALGGIAVGVLALGGAAFGSYTIGGLSIASKIALGDIARGYIAIGEKVHGVFFATGAISPQQVQELIREVYPGLWEPLVNLFATVVRFFY